MAHSVFDVVFSSQVMEPFEITQGLLSSELGLKSISCKHSYNTTSPETITSTQMVDIAGTSMTLPCIISRPSRAIARTFLDGPSRVREDVERVHSNMQGEETKWLREGCALSCTPLN